MGAVHDDRLTALDGIGVVLDGLLAAALIAFPHVVTPRFEAMFNEFGSGPLPVLTRLALAMWFPTALGAAPATGLVLGCIPAVPRAVRRSALVVGFVVGLFALAACLVGMYLPIYDLAGSIKA
jgi:type II secretory pathway component PulF